MEAADLDAGILRTARTRFFLLWLLAAVWAASIGIVAIQVWRYESTPGDLGQTPMRWPEASKIPLDAGRPSLVMLVHPQCSCTRASLDELRFIMERSQGTVSAWVLFVMPDATGSGRDSSPTWKQAQRIPGVHVLLDPKGAEGLRFGGLTSGHVVLYDRRGLLRFSGGITGARGHTGDNLGMRQLLALVHDGRAAAAHAVYGCPL